MIIYILSVNQYLDNSHIHDTQRNEDENTGSTLEVPVFKEKNRGWLKHIIQTYGEKNRILPG